MPPRKSFPPLPWDLSELGGYHKWKSPKGLLLLGPENTFEEEEEEWRNLKPGSCTYYFLYLIHILVQCQTQFAMHPQLHVPVIHLRLQTLGGEGRPMPVHCVQFKFCSMINGETLNVFCCPKVKRGYTELVNRRRFSKQKQEVIRAKRHWSGGPARSLALRQALWGGQGMCGVKQHSHSFQELLKN